MHDPAAVKEFLDKLYHDPAFKKPSGAREKGGFSQESLGGAVLGLASECGIELVSPDTLKRK